MICDVRKLPPLDQCPHVCPKRKGQGCTFRDATHEHANPCGMCLGRGVVSDEQFAQGLAEVISAR